MRKRYYNYLCNEEPSYLYHLWETQRGSISWTLMTSTSTQLPPNQLEELKTAQSRQDKTFKMNDKVKYVEVREISVKQSLYLLSQSLGRLKQHK